MPWHMTPDIWWNMKLKLHMKIDSGIGFEKGDFFKMDSTTMVISSPFFTTTPFLVVFPESGREGFFQKKRCH